MKIETNPVKAMIDVAKENSELHEEVQRVFKELDWYRGALEYISKMPNQASPVAVLALLRRPYKL